MMGGESMMLPESEMTIEWQPNPLETRVLLTDFGVDYLRLKLYTDELERSISFLARRKEVPSEQLEKVDAEVHKLLPDMLSSLTDIHCGDCICVPMTCIKCLTEDLLEIHTMKGLGKHEAAKIGSHFKTHQDIGSVIEALDNYEPSATWEGWEAHADRWRREAENATKWLKAYQIEHGF